VAYNVTGTNGNDTLNQTSDVGPGTIAGLAGDDCIFTGTGVATVSGDSGNDSVILQAGNTGTVNGGAENDSIHAVGAVGSMQLFGGAGADIFNTTSTANAQTIIGGLDSSDGNDTVLTAGGADWVFGNGGNDTVNAGGGNNTVIGGFGNDSIFTVAGADLALGNQGNDTLNTFPGADTAYGGQGNDSLFIGAGGPGALGFGNEGNDTIDGTGTTPVTMVGGQDSADGNDTMIGSSVSDLIFGNGGADTINMGLNAFADTVWGGSGNDSIVDTGGGNNLVAGNESNDTVFISAAGQNTVFGGQGNDSVATDGGRDTLQGNEGNDTIRGGGDIDTVAGGAGNDVFAYSGSADDGDNANGGGPVELITDVDFAVDRFQTAVLVTFATNTGAGTGGTLAASATNAIAAANALAGGGAVEVAAQFTFGGRTYLAINQDATFSSFTDATDLLIDISGATGTIGNANFI
jgi:Ca2+-binding RTX toxin-like protein